MRSANLWIGGLMIASLVAAAPAVNPPAAEKSKSTLSNHAAQTYAMELYGFVQAIKNQYVRDVPEEDLFFAAMSGLFEAVGEPIPPNLRTQLTQPKPNEWDGWARTAAGLSGLSPSLRTLAGPWLHIAGRQQRRPLAQSECLALLMRLRIGLGDRTALRDRQDLVVSINGLSKVLDPYCGFTHQNEFTLENEDTYSTGLQFDINAAPDPNMPAANSGRLPATLTIKIVTPGGPAQRAGLRPGDTVARIDGRACNEFTREKLHQLLSSPAPEAGDPDTSMDHAFEVRRPGVEKSRTVVMRPEKPRPESVFGLRRRRDGSWDYRISQKDRLCYARIGAIGEVRTNTTTTHSTPMEIQGILRQMQAEKCEGLILDLRWCPGGFLEPALATARTFVGEDKLIVSLQYRDPTKNTPALATPPGESILGPTMVVLINNETIGGGELIAAALQDYHRATIAGERTFGKATVQQKLDPNPIGLDYKISAGVFLRPNGKNLQRFPTSKPSDDWGIRPDPGRWLPLSPAASKQLKEWWTWHVLRPANSTEALPTDDPEIDPQLNAAIQMLRQLTSQAKS
ncbi:MAG: S41 family peptidase [Gemmataceae bacterium]